MQTAAQLTINLPFHVRRVPVRDAAELTRHECRVVCKVLARFAERTVEPLNESDFIAFQRAYTKLKKRRNGRGRRKA